MADVAGCTSTEGREAPTGFLSSSILSQECGTFAFGRAQQFRTVRGRLWLLTPPVLVTRGKTPTLFGVTVVKAVAMQLIRAYSKLELRGLLVTL